MVMVSKHAIAAGLILWANPAIAQEQESMASTASPETGAGEGLEEIVATAQKRSESLQKTPISIVALTGADLEKKGINDISDLRSLVPSLDVTPHPNSATTARVFIRGVGNNDDQITADPSVAVYLDGIYIARGQGLSAEVAEIERIEVLRGPQGSLYGRNATGGAINYITRAPTLGEFHAKQALAYGNCDQFRTRTHINIPIGDTLAIELAYLHSQKDGFVDNLGTGVDRFGDQRRDAYRAAALWQPVKGIELRYSYDRSDIKDTPVFLARAPFYPAMAHRPSAGSPFVRDLMRNDVTSQGHNFTASWEVSDNLTIKSLTGYRKLSNSTNQNYMTGATGPFPLILTGIEQSQKQWSEEFQLIGSAFDRQLEYVLGAYYFDEKGESFDVSSIASRPRVDRDATIQNRAYAIYGQATWRPQFLEGLYLTGGLRWSRDEREATLDQTLVPAAGSPTILPQGRGDNDFSNVSPSVVIGYDINPDVNVYAKYARGYKTGGYNLRASSIARFNQGYGPETLDSFELGIKSTWLDNRLRLNAALFRSNYKDIQTNVQTDLANPAITDVFNAGKARIQGIELELTVKPAENLTFSASYAYLDARFQEIIDPATGADITAPTPSSTRRGTRSQRGWNIAFPKRRSACFQPMSTISCKVGNRLRSTIRATLSAIMDCSTRA